MVALDTSLCSDELLHKFNLIDEHATLGNFHLEAENHLRKQCSCMCKIVNCKIYVLKLLCFLLSYLCNFRIVVYLELCGCFRYLITF